MTLEAVRSYATGFGRWDTNSHPIADAHPDDLKRIVFPGQDYNNARVYDFENVDKWENNKRTS
jgi:phospholipase D1/2